MKEELLRKLSSEDKGEVREAVEALAEYEDPEVVKALIDTALSRRSRAVLEAVKGTLMSFRREKETVCREVLRLFESPEPKLRQTAIEILSSLGNPCLPFIRERLVEHADYNMRKFALDILSEIGSEEALSVLSPLLEDENPNVRMTALEYLRNFSTFREKVVPLIVKAIPSVNDLYGLTTLASTVIYGNIRDQRLIEPLREKLKELEDPLSRHWVYKTLIFLGDREVVNEALANAQRIGTEEDIRKDMEIFFGE